MKNTKRTVENAPEPFAKELQAHADLLDKPGFKELVLSTADAVKRFQLTDRKTLVKTE